MSSDHPPALASRAEFLSSFQELGGCICNYDWSATPLGAIGTWPQSLRTALSACLGSPLVTAVLWGPDYRMLYNDAYAATLSDRHPWALGRPIVEVWAEIGDLLAGQLAQVMRTGQGFATDG